MANFLIQFAIAVATSTIMLIFGTAIIEAMRRRGFDPVGAIATFLAPTDVASAGALES